MDRKNEPEPLKLLRLKAVMQLTGLKKSTLYALIKRGLFPRQHKLATRAVAWLAHEIQAWIQNRSGPAVSS
ncbi:MAG: AlpA family phage regulatory protein [Polaromonas sp.]|uniref:helix-turn-helix transcriptional regulator n=1 Tax=Polaromonas sp. TaxID=1869339 RepID=UPI0024876CE1|nr:AlpA family phage regulatory protein [Polaromonas sp.]MDI1238666.1 AlpA family phage regulatory protein [Polaromonas sp.]